MTEPTRQLPGVKGQWILAADCPPTEVDADEDGDVCVLNKAAPGILYKKHGDVRVSHHWRPRPLRDPRPFTLPAAPAPEQPAAVKRKFDKLTSNADGSLLWAVADDGTAWLAGPDAFYPDDNWRQLPALPDREV